MPVTDFTGTGKVNPWRTIQGPSLLELAPVSEPAPTFQDLNFSSGSAIGVTNEISFNPNISSEESYCAQLKHPYAIHVSRRAEQISTELKELDVWNFAMALSYHSSVVTESSYFYIDDSANNVAETATSSPYRSVRLTTEGVADTGNPAPTEQITVLFKARPIGEEVTYGPETESTIPLTFHAVASGKTDRIGVLYGDDEISDPGY